MKQINFKEFKKLDFDTKCAIICEHLPEDYFGGQEEIGFWIPENYDPESTAPLPPTPPEIEKEEDKKFEELIERLTIKLFRDHHVITYAEQED